MAHWFSDRELELACKVGSIADIDRTLDEGADPNCDGGSPLFLAIMSGRHETVAHILEKGASPTYILPESKLKKLKSEAEILEALIACCPPPLTEEEKKDDGKELLKDEEAPAEKMVVEEE